MRAARTTAAGAMLVVLLAGSARARQDATFVRVRPIDPRAHTLLREGLDRSPTVRALVATLERSDLVIHVETDPFLDQRGHVWLAGSVEGCRYVRLTVRAPGFRPRVLSVLAHELQHAIEIARAPQVRNEPALQGLLHRNGWVSRNGRLAESRAALAVEKRVYEEVVSGRSRQR